MNLPSPLLIHRSSSLQTGASLKLLLLLLQLGLFRVLTSTLVGVGAQLSTGSKHNSYRFPQWPVWKPSGRAVRLTSGLVRGKIFTPDSSHRLQEVEVFLGIPYAAPPVGRLRFQAPQPAAKWDGVRDLEYLPPVCVQAFPNISTSSKQGHNEEFQLKTSASRLKYLQRIQPFIDGYQSEDCLYLNVYVPAAHRKTDSRMPVLVIVSAGDSYSRGAGNYVDASVIASHTNSVVITFNYRVGILGFLPNSLSGMSAANVGLRDQVEVLKWLRQNVASFGGDREKVTLLGAGRAAVFVHLHMINPAATGLFRRAALIGGSALSSWALCHDADKQLIQLAKLLRCEPGNPVECLRGRSAQELVQVSATLLVPEHLCGPFGPTPDDDLVPLDVYAATSAYASAPSAGSSSNLFAQHDLLAGVTKWESYQLFNDYQRIHGVEADYKERALRTLVRNSYLFHQNEILFSISNEYTDWQHGERSEIDILRETAGALSDATVVAPLMKVTTLHSRLTSLSKSQRSTYFYVFAYRGTSCEYSHLYSCSPDSEEALNFLLGMPLLDHQSARQPHLNYSWQDAQVSEFLLNYWSDFLRTGQPNSSTIEIVNSERPSRPVTEEITWRQFEALRGEYLSVESRPRSLQHFDSHRMSLWNRLIPALHRADKAFSGNRWTENLISDNLSAHESPSYRLLVSLQAATSAPMLRSSALDSLLSSAVVSTPAASDGEQVPRAFNGDHLPLSLETLASGPYSKALFITITVGCSLLVVNLLVFVGTYYQHRSDLDYGTTTARRACQKNLGSSTLSLDTRSLYSLGPKSQIFKELSSFEVQDGVPLSSADLLSLMIKFCTEPTGNIDLSVDKASSILRSNIDASQTPVDVGPADETSV